MTKEQEILQKKAEALNAIRKLYNEHNYGRGIGLSHNRWDESWSEQRDSLVKGIVDNLEKAINKIKKKYKEKEPK